MFSLDARKYMTASNFPQRRKLEYNWTLQESTVWKNTFPPPFYDQITAQRADRRLHVYQHD